jgi:ribosome-binding protein aMBF1 (putative translation factor)
MRCEVCGRKILSDPVMANIEGAKLTVCIECSKHGKVVYEDPAISQPSPTKSYINIPTIMKKPPVAQVQITTEVVYDYATSKSVLQEKNLFCHTKIWAKKSTKKPRC